MSNINNQTTITNNTIDATATQENRLDDLMLCLVAAIGFIGLIMIF